ncbi:MAG: hypothetical protein WC612_08740 [Bdellovibrionales bacterium]|jgi:hypothetical protein
MYLFVYVFLLMSVMGLYTQLFVLSTSRMAENQKGVAEIMLVWHGAAYKKAKSATTSPLTDCYLYNGGWGAACGNVIDSTVLPSGYQLANPSFLFRSYVYTSGSTRYVVTYVPPPPATNTLGYSAQQILAQMRNTDFPKISYGGVATTSCNGTNGHWLVTNELSVTGGTTRQVCYPMDPIVLDGSAGIISILGS